MYSMTGGMEIGKPNLESNILHLAASLMMHTELASAAWYQKALRRDDMITCIYA